jgi:hypothetical protein
MKPHTTATLSPLLALANHPACTEAHFGLVLLASLRSTVSLVSLAALSKDLHPPPTHHEAALRECAQVDAATQQLHLALHQEKKVVTLQGRGSREV